MRKIIKTNSADESMLLGEKFAGSLKPGDVVLFEGELGGGKTTFIKGVLRGLGYKGRVLSPTFVLARQYPVKKVTVYHVDLYRLTQGQFQGVGIDDFLYGPDSITLIEWGEKIEKELPRYTKLAFFYTGENSRKIIIDYSKAQRAGRAA